MSQLRRSCELIWYLSANTKILSLQYVAELTTTNRINTSWN